MSLKKTIKPDGTIVLEGVFAEFNKGNGRIYPRDFWEREMERLRHEILIKDRRNKLDKINEKIKNNNKVG